MFGVNVRQVVKGHVNEILGREQLLSEDRMKICKACPLFSDSFGGLCDSKKCWNTSENKLVYGPGEKIICGCGCRLEAKTRLKRSHCVLNKW